MIARQPQVGDKVLYLGHVGHVVPGPLDSWHARKAHPSVVIDVDEHWVTSADLLPFGASSTWRVVPEQVRVIEAATYEPVLPPEPQWEPGDAVRDKFGHAHIRSYGGTWIDPDGTRILDAKMDRPLTRLVPGVSL